MRGLGCAVVLFAACDRVFGTAPPESPPFGAPVRIDELASDDNDEDATLTTDLLEIVFVSNRPNGFGSQDLWTSSRQTADEPFAAPTTLPAPLNTSSREQHPHLTPDGRVLYFSSDRDGEMEIYRSERSAPGAPWSEPTIVSEIGAAGAIDQMGSTAFDQRMLALSSGREVGEARRDLYLYTRERLEDPWSGVVRLNNTTTPESSPFLTREGTAVYFTRQEDLYRARIEGTGPDARLVDEELVDELSTAAFEEADPWLVDDESLIVFSTTAASGNHDLHVATRTRE